jgi:hypothetical protein
MYMASDGFVYRLGNGGDERRRRHGDKGRMERQSSLLV